MAQNKVGLRRTMGSFEWHRDLRAGRTLFQFNYLDVKVGLYKDDGLATCAKSPKQVDAFKKEMCKIFEHNSLHITIEANKKLKTSYT